MPGSSSRRELEIVGAVAEALNSSPSVQAALERTLELVTGLLGLQTGWVWLTDPETGHMYSAAARNLPPYLQDPVRMSGESLDLSGRGSNRRAVKVHISVPFASLTSPTPRPRLMGEVGLSLCGVELVDLSLAWR